MLFFIERVRFAIVLGWLVAVSTDRCAVAAAPKLKQVDPATVGMSATRLDRIDEVVAGGLERGRMPGCVVLVGRGENVVYFKSYGYRELTPEKVLMTTDTVFDLASLTKPVATATSVIRLIEQGKIELSDPVAKYIPEFGANS